MFYKVLGVVLLVVGLLQADSSDNVGDVLRSKIHKAVMANTNALMVFTSQDMISSGQYKLSSANDEARVKIINFPFLYHFKNSSFYNFFVLGALGRSVFDMDVTVLEEMSKDETSFETYIAKIGGGVRFKGESDFEALVGASIIYSRIYNTYKFKSEISDIYKEIFEDEFANKSSDALSYDLFLEFAYRPNFNEWKPYIVLNYNYYDAKSFTDIKDFEVFKTQSSVSDLRFGFESAALLEIQKMPLTVEAYTSGSVVSGDIQSSLGFESYGELGVLSHLYLKNKIYPLSQVYVGYSQVSGDGIKGYNVGFGVSLSF